MMKKTIILFVLGIFMAAGMQAQRVIDRLNRGLVAIPQGDKDGQDTRYGTSGSGIFVQWRILPTEYFDTKYNLYRNGTKIASNLTVSNYEDASGSKTSLYKVIPVVRGVERKDLASEEVQSWNHQYWDIPVKPVVGRDGTTVTGYSLNDCSVADVDGDGQMEFVVKRRNDIGEGANVLRSASNRNCFNLHECYKMDGTRLWWIDMGPNLMSGPDEQFDLILYDWDQDGKAEAVMRGSDNMIIHTATGKDIKIGNMTTGFGVDRPEYMGVGNEYLLYLNGETGEPYGWDGKDNWTPAAYPLPQFEEGETKGDAGIWGDLGHRMQKHYFGAPYIDGRNPAIFLGRGCYTRHKFCALSVNPETHELTQLWRWNCYQGGSPWFGNGFHNYQIADVDMDGRDEIVFGSMVIDDTGYGLATTGFGHGDAQHCGDFDPYRWGLEQFVCLESAAVPGVAYTNATTGELRYVNGTGGDNGRCMAGNFLGTYPGGIGISGGAISLVADRVMDGVGGWSDDHVNMRVYWDGDLLDEFMDSPGTEKSPCVYKAPGQAEVGTERGTYPNDRCWMGAGNLNNSSKNNPCFLGDILGDWREEIVTRVGDVLRIQITSYPSKWGITTLWADHEYRNAMTWQSVGYNQPPHPSFFLGELENITNCPPAVTLEGRSEVQGTISSTDADEQLLVSGYEDKTIAVTEGASPWVLVVNTPAWVQGTGAQQATTSTPKQPKQNIVTYTTTLTGGAFGGAMRLVKQGEGVLVLPNVVEKHTGKTDVWNGTLQFDGTMESSSVWLNRHTTLVSDGGKFMGGLKADYNATIYPGGRDHVGSITASKLQLGFGSRVVIDVQGTNFDQLNADVLAIETKSWQYGPRYKAPVLQFVGDVNIPAGTYEIATVGTLTGKMSEILLEGLSNEVKATLINEDGKLKLKVEEMREAGDVTWNGTSGNNTWIQASSENFMTAAGEQVYSAFGDDIVFDDQAAITTVNIKGAVNPRSVTFNNEKKSYIINGDSIVGGGTITKNGKGKVTINNWNHTGATTINDGTVTVAMLANNSGQDWGSLGNSSSQIYLNDGATLQTNGVIVTDQTLNVQGEATVDVPSGKSVIFNKGIKGSGATLIKTGAGSMETGTQTNSYAKLVIKAGTMTSNYSSSNVDMLPKTVEFQGGSLWGANMEGGSGISNSSNFVVEKGKTGTFYGSFRGVYTGKLTGEGTFNVHTGGVRCYFDGDWSAFTGTVNAYKTNRQNKKTYDPVWAIRSTKGLPKATLNVASEVSVSNEGKNIPVGKLAGSGSLNGTGTWVVGSSDANFSVSTLTINSPVEKRGTGKMTLTVGKMNGALTVSGGTVSFNNTTFSAPIHGAYLTTVKNDGSVVGQGLLNAISLQSGATLIPCGSTANSTTPGTIKCNFNATVAAGATVEFIVGSTTNSTIEAKNLTFNGTLKLNVLPERLLQVGDELKLWTISGTFTGTPTLDLPAGITFDDSRLATEGVLVVTDIDASISSVFADMDARNVYDLSGRLVGRQATEVSTEGLPRGIYIRAGRKVLVK
jgi:autotransporter-associated beta strand protein